MYCQSNNWWIFCKILWPSQNIWTLKPWQNKKGLTFRGMLLLCMCFFEAGSSRFKFLKRHTRNEHPNKFSARALEPMALAITKNLCGLVRMPELYWFFILYLVRDINSPIYFSPIHEYCFNKICRYEYLNDTVKCIWCSIKF